MLELRRSEAWDSVSAQILPTANLTTLEIKKLAAREELIDGVIKGIKDANLHVKINKGIFRGTIFRIQELNDKRWRVDVHVERYRDTAVLNGFKISSWLSKGKDHTKKYNFSERMIAFYSHSGNEGHDVRFHDGRIYPWLMGGEVTGSASLLIGYQGPEVFVIDEAKRPLVFKDRLGQDVTVGDLVVVALNYGGGLDICVVRGFADENRMVIESVETGVEDRITLTNNMTNKVMRMPNTLKDTALMLKLAS